MSFAAMDTIPGRVRQRRDVPTPAGYAVFDCETTGIDPEQDEIVSFALLRLDAGGAEFARSVYYVRPSRPIPAEATAVHGITDDDVAHAPRFWELAPELLWLLEGAVFVAHNASFDLAMLRHGLASVGCAYEPPGVACTLEAFRLLEPLLPAHNLEALCRAHNVELTAHDALGDALATAALLRLILAAGLAPETVELDEAAAWRLRSRGDVRPATERQIARVFALGHDAGLADEDILELVARVTRAADVESLTREQVQDVYDALELDRAA
jgi:DNA polymerase III epsilon subunit family exonuclease